ncbi:di-trans,poly-cis-decaprenylcistransferase [Deltaproteobacteria bacterium Smac51]|nr:di-trans,poly-cis-decaprenylcistransferase [Deltaproteobacteria bacterium Smac51]
MDGNGRWATRQGLERPEGHKAGAEPVRAVMRAARDCGVSMLTLYAFSTENWGRPKDEVQGLFSLLVKYLKTELKELVEKQVRLRAIGDIDSLPHSARHALGAAMAATAKYEKFTLNLALSYGSRFELARAARLLAEEVASGQRDAQSITPEAIGQKLWTADMPDPDLLIRTGGDMRLSNFLLWQCAYTEFYFTPTLWPDFGEAEFKAALESFHSRERRFGLAEAQG